VNSSLARLNINDVQNNPFQPDVQYRGFTPSPLLGLPQGLSVYLNGVRFNERFGDTINWDLFSLSSIDNVTLYSGSNPIVGQNTLGGTLSLTTKNGFDLIIMKCRYSWYVMIILVKPKMSLLLV